MAKEPVRVLVIGAANSIGYALVPMIARGKMFGVDQPVILHMLGIPLAAEALKGVKMELIDAAFPLLKGVVATTDAIEACTGVNVAVMLECFGRTHIMLNDVSIYKSQLAALEKHAAPNCKVLVIDNPVDTNALFLKECAPSISEKNITCLTRLDHNMALGQISERLNVPVSDVKNVIIWGNYSSSTLYPDVNHATIKTSSGEKSVRELVKDDDWLNGEFITKVQQRGVDIIKARGLTSAISKASSACDHIRDWVLGTPEGTFVSMGVYSDGSYNVPSGLIYSFPVTCHNGEWTIVQELELVTMPPEKTKEMEKSLEGMQKEIGKIGAMQQEMGVMRSILEDIRKKMVEDEQRAAKAKAPLQEEVSRPVSEVVMQTREGISKEPSNLQSSGEWIIVQGLSTDEVPRKKIDYDIRVGSSASQQSSVPNSPPSSHSTSARRPPTDRKEFLRQTRSRLSYDQFNAFVAIMKQNWEETLRKAEEIFGTENNDLYILLKGVVSSSH